MELTRHIEILLLDNDCVIVPGLGGIMAHYAHAEYSEEDEAYYPPQRTIGFNPQLQLNDSLLAQSYVEAYDVSYPEALRMIAAEVEEVKQTLAIDGSYTFHGIGTLRYTSDDKYDFEPCTAGLLTPSLYALSSYGLKAVARKAVAPMQVVVNKDHEGEAVRQSKTRRIDIDTLRYALVAAMLLLLFIFSSIPAGVGSSDIEQCSVIDTNVVTALLKHDKAMEDTISGVQATDADAAADNITETDTTIPSNTSEAQNQQQKGYTIILASKVSKKGAEEYIKRLGSMGYHDVRIYERGTMRRVVMGTFDNEQQATDSLRRLRIKDHQFADAWIDHNA